MDTCLTLLLQDSCMFCVLTDDEQDSPRPQVPHTPQRADSTAGLFTVQGPKTDRQSAQVRSHIPVLQTPVHGLPLCITLPVVVQFACIFAGS